LLAGAELGAVVEVHAVGDVGEVTGDSGLLHLLEELVFAVEAAVGVVALVVGVFELVGAENLDGDVVIGDEGEGSGEFGAREGGGVGDDGLHVVAEGLVGGVGEVGGVGAAGVGDQDAAELLQSCVELRGFGGKVHELYCRAGWTTLVFGGTGSALISASSGLAGRSDSERSGALLSRRSLPSKVRLIFGDLEAR
jgi:hypothetical protein